VAILQSGWRLRSNSIAGRVWVSSFRAYAIAAMMLVGGVLRFSFLASKSLWLDEAVTAQRVSLPLRQLITVSARTEMPLYHLVVYGWVLIAGNSEFMLRFPSALFAVATIPLIAVLGTEVSDGATGLLSALLLTVNETSIQYAQNARSYALLMMLVTLSSIFFVKSIKRGTLADCTGYVLSGASGSYAHLFGILILPAQWASSFLFLTSRRTTKRVQISVVAIGILSVPALEWAISGDQGQVNWIAGTSLRSLLQLFYVLAGASRDIVPASAARYLPGSRDSLSLPLLLLYLAAIALALIRSRSQNRAGVIYLLLCLVIPICLAVIVSFFKPLFVTRYLLITLPFFITAAAMGITYIPWRAAIIAVATTITVFSLTEDYSYYRAASFQDWRGAVRFVAQRAKPGDVLMVYPGYNIVPVQHYVARLDRSIDFPRRILMEAELPEVKRPDRLAQEISKNRSNEMSVEPGARIWFVSAFYNKSDERLLEALQMDYRVADQPNIPGLRLLLLVSRRDQL
jgi:mannosyltransferase